MRSTSKRHSATGRVLQPREMTCGETDTIVFDKTGTLTKAKPVVADVIPFQGDEPDELLSIAACLEEHFPHSLARAVVEAAGQKGLEHIEMHSRVEYIVACGIDKIVMMTGDSERTARAIVEKSALTSIIRKCCRGTRRVL